MASNGLLGNNITAQWIQLVICIVISVHNMIILVWHTKTVFYRRKTLILFNEWISIFILFVALLFPISFSVKYTHFTSDIVCNIIFIIVMCSYSLSKLAFYCFLLERLFLVIEFKRYKVILSRVVIISWTISSTCLLCVSGGGYYDVIIGSCRPKFPVYIVMNGFLSDLIISIVILIVLSRKIKTFYFRQDVQISGLLKKCTLLSLIGIITTQLTMLISLIIGIGGIWFSLDIAINNWCMILTFHVNALLYSKICGYLDSCVGNKCLSCFSCNCCCCRIKNEKKKEMLDVNIKNETTNSTTNATTNITTNSTTSTTNGSTINSLPKLDKSVTSLDRESMKYI
eukprot:40569_1